MTELAELAQFNHAATVMSEGLMTVVWFGKAEGDFLKIQASVFVLAS